jgi:hypothetical protein
MYENNVSRVIHLVSQSFIVERTWLYQERVMNNKQNISELCLIFPTHCPLSSFKENVILSPIVKKI